MIRAWLHRRRLRAAIQKQWTEPRKIVEFANPHGTADVVVAVMDKNYEQIHVTFEVSRHVVRIHLPPDYDESNLTVKIYG